MIEIFGYTFEHLTITREIGNPVRGYAVRTDEGYYIHKPSFGENVFKTSTAIYATDDLTAIIVIPASELPEGAEIMGGNTTPETETV
jgi:hypothetical protein